MAMRRFLKRVRSMKTSEKRVQGPGFRVQGSGLGVYRGTSLIRNK